MDRDSEIQLRLKGGKKKALSKARARWVDREVLGVLQHDKNYLTQFLKRPGSAFSYTLILFYFCIQSTMLQFRSLKNIDIAGNQSGSDNLKTSANEALKFLDIRENFWRQQNPMYARKVGLNFNNDVIYISCNQKLIRCTRICVMWLLF